MRDFRRKPGQLAALPSSSKLVYTGYLLFLLVALGVASWLYSVGPGIDPSHASAYYAGGEVPAAPREHTKLPGLGGSTASPTTAPAALAGAGPELELDGLVDPLDAAAPPASEAPDPAQATELRPPMNLKRLVELTHGHLFVMPLVWLVVAHLFALAGLGPRVTMALVVLSGLGVASHLTAPWLIRDVAVSLVWTLPFSGALMVLSLGFMALVALVALWAPRAARPPKPARGAEDEAGEHL